MAINQIILSVLIIFHLQWVTRCDFTSADYFSKDLTFRLPANAANGKATIANTPALHWKYFYFNYINCDLMNNKCEVGQDCFNCPKSYEAKKCHLTLPYNDSSLLEQVTLKAYGDYAEHIIVDWASRAVVNETLGSRINRKIQLINAANCIVQDITIELPSTDNGLRKIVLDSLAMIKSLDVFYIDYRSCSDSGWVRMKYNEDGKASKEAECIFGLEKSKHKFFMDVVMGSDLSEIMLDKSKDKWTLYELKNQSNHASEFHKGSNRNGDLFDIPRLAMQSDDFGSLCWLADIEPSYSLNCTIFRVEPKYVRNLSLEFHYKVRDFELKMVDFKRIYVLTSSSDDTSCTYDLWIFDINGSVIDGPLRIQGPRCVFTHRLEPRPVITHLNRDKICVSFAFQRSAHDNSSSSHRRKQIDDSAQEQQFTLMTECFLHSN